MRKQNQCLPFFCVCLCSIRSLFWDYKLFLCNLSCNTASTADLFHTLCVRHLLPVTLGIMTFPGVHVCPRMSEPNVVPEVFVCHERLCGACGLCSGGRRSHRTKKLRPRSHMSRKIAHTQNTTQNAASATFAREHAAGDHYPKHEGDHKRVEDRGGCRENQGGG